ncbi:MAG: NADH:ubiquinone oxidoreductase subunit NDUFA12 [Hyphomonadaceae bacterium]|nr:NADH:ubiquinone oxidoreductase subunit NDUFA12 [Hyphomonadaceae bacterium]MBX3511615.1 NADH:ubiquinone oxidoreductase subunit NDUFA12 [Hyphomonadaceae bacterium]
MLTRILTWWNGATLGALFDINRRGAFVGEDEQGNRYFEERRPSLEGRKRRYVLYKGLAEASRVPPDWHAWMHHISEEPPTVRPLKRQPWEQPHIPNLTGTVRAYRPRGSLARGGVRAPATADYEAWSPDTDSGGARD